MTSWSVVRSISAMRSTSTRAARLDRGERLGRDQAAGGLRAGDRELDPQHLLEARLVGPDRAHLGQRVARDHRTPRAAPAAQSGRCRAAAGCPGAWIAVRGRASAASRAPRRGPAPRPTTVRTRPPAVARSPSASRRVPAWKTSAPVARARRRAPRSGRPRAARRGSRRPPGRSRRSPRAGPAAGRRAARPDRHAARQVAARRGEQERPERDGQPRQDRLRLRVAEAGVALEQARAVGGEHQAGVQRAAERRPAPGQLGEDRPVERGEQDRRPPSSAQVRQRASRRPCRPCSGRCRRRRSRLWSRAAGSASASRRRTAR